MKICVISTPVFKIPVSGYSGLEHLAWQIGAGLAVKGHEVFVVAPEGSSCPGCTIIPNGPAGTWDESKAYQQYWQHLISMDAIIDHSWQKWSLVLKAEGVLKAPVLSVCHAPVNTMYQSLPPIEKPCFVCISEDQRMHFEALFGRDARSCLNGVDSSFYSPISGIARTNRYLFLARFSSIKAPDLAIEVCKKAGVGLDLIGDTSITNEPEYLRKVKSMTDGSQIKIVGPATRGECVRWFSQAHALVHLCPQFREPFGLSPVESMACGCPVLAWKYGAVKETIIHGETGFLVTSMDEAVDLIKSDALGKLDRNRCRERAKEFSVERMVNRYEELCLEAIQTGGW